MPLLHPRATAETFRPDMMIAIGLIHLAVLAAPFTFSWPAFGAAIVMYYATGCLGITLCFHRLLSHRSYKTNKFVRGFLMLCGTLAMQGSPSWWTATHRLHHSDSDQELDPHSPRVSFLWSHVLWLFYTEPKLKDNSMLSRYIPDMINDPWARFLSNYFIHVNVAFLFLLYGIGYAMGGPKMAISMLVWAGFVRIVAVWHITWFVNSVTHLFGYRSFETRDDSRNLWWVALLSFGEGWHNNHHAHPSTCRSGYRWWEFDLTYGIIKVMQMLGLAWKIHPIPSRQRVTAPVTTLPPTTPAKMRG